MLLTMAQQQAAALQGGAEEHVLHGNILAAAAGVSTAEESVALLQRACQQYQRALQLEADAAVSIWSEKRHCFSHC